MKKILVIVLAIFFFNTSIVLAGSSSANYSIDKNNTQNSSANSASGNFQINCQQVGDTAVGTSASNNFHIIHGVICNRSITTINIKCLPSNRYLVNGNNWSDHVIIEVRPVGGDINSIIFSQEVVTNNDGVYNGLTLSGVSPGVYDVTCKGWNTLRLKESNVTLTNGALIDFSHGGTRFALSGDIDNNNEGNRSNSVELGDNEINAADYSILVTRFGNTPGPAEERYDLDAYGGNASAADYSILVFNYNNVGE